MRPWLVVTRRPKVGLGRSCADQATSVVTKTIGLLVPHCTGAGSMVCFQVGAPRQYLRRDARRAVRREGPRLRREVRRPVRLAVRLARGIELPPFVMAASPRCASLSCDEGDGSRQLGRKAVRVVGIATSSRAILPLILRLVPPLGFHLGPWRRHQQWPHLLRWQRRPQRQPRPR